MHKSFISSSVIAVSLLLATPSTHAMQKITIDTNSALRAIGVLTAAAGLWNLAREKGSKVSGSLLLTLGIGATLGTDRIVEETNRHVLKPGFLNSLQRDATNFVQEASRVLETESR